MGPLALRHSRQREDTLAGEASTLDQSAAPLHVRTVQNSAARLARDRTMRPGRSGKMYVSLHPAPGAGGKPVDRRRRAPAAGRTLVRFIPVPSRNRGRDLSDDCEGCQDIKCAADTPIRVLLRCPAPSTPDFGYWTRSNPRWRTCRSPADVVVDLGDAYRSLQSQLTRSKAGATSQQQQQQQQVIICR